MVKRLSGALQYRNKQVVRFFLLIVMKVMSVIIMTDKVSYVDFDGLIYEIILLIIRT